LDGLLSILAFRISLQMREAFSCRFLVVDIGRIFALFVNAVLTHFILCLVVRLMNLFPEIISCGNTGIILSSFILMSGIFGETVRTTVDLDTDVSLSREREKTSLNMTD
jgi:hypothetical protein